MKRAFRSIAVWTVCLLIGFCFPGGVRAADCTETADEIIAGQVQAAGAVSVQQWIEDPLCAAAGSGGADWYIMALSHSTERYDCTAYGKALLDVLAEGSSNAVTRQRNALAFLAVSPYSVNSFRTLLEETLGQQGIMSYVYGLHLQNNGVPSSVSPEDTVAKLLSMQLADGGWALSGSRSDVDVTAMTIQALAAHREDTKTEAAIQKAVDFLSASQLDNGGYQSYGTPNPESTAQVWMALSLLEIDALSDARFIKYCTLYDAILEFRCGEGQFAHTIDGSANTMATVQVFLAVTAYDMMQSGKGSFYHFADPIPLPEESTVSQITATTTTVTTTTTTVLTTEAETGTTADSSGETTAESTSAVTTSTTGKKDPFVWRPDAYLLKWVLTAAILVGAAIAVLVLMKRQRRHMFHYVAVGLIAALLIAAVHCIRIQLPDDYYAAADSQADSVGTVTFSIRCDLLPHDHHHTALPADGLIVSPTEIAFAEGDTVLTALEQVCREKRIQTEIDGTDALAYVRGIADLYEFDYGDLSGWTYLVNGETPSVGCGQYALAHGDTIQWVYTLEQGNDI